MGCGGSQATEPKKTDQSTGQNQLASSGEGKTESQLIPQSQQLQEVAPSGHSRKNSTTSLASAKPSPVSPIQKQGSAKQSSKNSSDSSEDENSPRELDNNSPRGSIDNQLPPIDNPTGESISSSSTRSSPRAPLPPIDNPTGKSTSSSSTVSSPRPPLPSIGRRQTGSNSISESHTSSHGNKSATYRGKDYRCSQCPHCRRVAKETLRPPIPRWVTKDPGEGLFRIQMDKYDIDAIKEKAIIENGHVRGSYDYRTQLTIENSGDYDLNKENYYTQPFVAKTTPRILPTRTPFPEYDVLQRHDRRINKPYTLSLFAD